MIDPAIRIIVTWGLALLLAFAARHKAVDGPRFRAQLAEYRLLPAAMVAPAALTLMLVELITAVGLLLPGTRSGAALVAAALLALYAGAMAVNIARGRSHIDCGCGDAPQLLSPWLVLRNLVLALAACWASLTVTDRALGGLDAVLMPLGLLAVLGVWLALEQLLANQGELDAWREQHAALATDAGEPS